PAPVPTQERETPYKGPQTDQVILKDVLVESTPAQPVEPKSIGDLDLRPSPIEDLPVERVYPRPAAPQAAQASQAQPPDVPSITSTLPAVHPTPAPARDEVREEVKVHNTARQPVTIETEPDKAIDLLLVEQLPDLPSVPRGRTPPPAT